MPLVRIDDLPRDLLVIVVLEEEAAVPQNPVLKAFMFKDESCSSSGNSLFSAGEYQEIPDKLFQVNALTVSRNSLYKTVSWGKIARARSLKTRLLATKEKPPIGKSLWSLGKIAFWYGHLKKQPGVI